MEVEHSRRNPAKFDLGEYHAECLVLLRARGPDQQALREPARSFPCLKAISATGDTGPGEQTPCQPALSLPCLKAIPIYVLRIQESNPSASLPALSRPCLKAISGHYYM